MNNKVILLIMDGWGIGDNKAVSAVHKASTPFYDKIITEYPKSLLKASGENVGLPRGQMGNSEVGHMNIGAGRIVDQDLIRLNKNLSNKGVKNNVDFTNSVKEAITNNKDFHIIGLLSNGGVHSHSNHLYYILDFLKEQKLKNIFIHVFTDGRDTSPNKGINEVKKLEEYIEKTNIQIATVSGRYYSMDRDSRWERIKLAYDAMVNGIGELSSNLIESIQTSYDNSITDEFINPVVHINNKGTPYGIIKDGDILFSFNYRSDRMRQISRVLTQEDFKNFQMRKKNISYLTMTNYDSTFDGIKVLFDKENIRNTLGEVLEKNNKIQLRIAETEKYPHVTFFFSGGREKEFDKEFRILCDSPKVATYDLKPEMSALELSSKFIDEVNNNSFDFACLNFANPDMVGHTGNFNAAVKACEVVDKEVSKIADIAMKNGYTVLVTADHGNAEMMVNIDGSPHTYHTTNLVPFVLLSNNKEIQLKDGKLGDIAPTVLDIMNIETPQQMTGQSLIK